MNDVVVTAALRGNTIFDRNPNFWGMEGGFAYEEMVEINKATRNFKNQMLQFSRTKDQCRVDLLPWVSHNRILDVQLPFREDLFPYWKEFGLALKSKKRVDDFSICQIELNSTILRMLAPTIQTLPLKSMKLARNGLGYYGIYYVAEFLRINTTLETLSLEGVPIEGMHAANYLSQAIQNHPSLKSVSLDNCDVGKNAGVVSTILNGCRDLDSLSLEDNGIGSRDATYVAKFLATNPPMTYLSLSGNMIQDENSVAFGASLKTNSNLVTLCLRDNEFSEAGKNELTKIVFDTTSLNSITASNHSCGVMFDHQARFESLLCNINRDGTSTRSKIRSKVCLALKIGGQKVVEKVFLQDLPLNLMPYGLELIQFQDEEVPFLETSHFIDSCVSFMEHCPLFNSDFIEEMKRNEKKQHLEKESLTRLFNVLRDWNMPLLYQNYSEPKNKKGSFRRLTTLMKGVESHLIHGRRSLARIHCENKKKQLLQLRRFA